jgi:hypothetical protein
MSKPILLRNYIIVQKDDDVSVTLSYPAISSTTQPADSFDRITCLMFICNSAGLMISRGVIDYEYFVRMRAETANSGETSLKKVGTVTGTDDNGRSNRQLAGIG